MMAYCYKVRNEYEEGYYQLGKKAGRREVVGWMLVNLKPEHWYGGGWDGMLEKGITDYFISAEIWQAKLKEWGLT